jgi:hypothetical protein
MQTLLPHYALQLDCVNDWMILKGYKSYGVSKTGKEPLLTFVLDGLRQNGCNILYHTGPEKAPFLIAFETPAGERIAVLCYAFLANRKETKHRPQDERRFQLKYGSDTRALLELADDPTGIVTNLLIGIDTVRGYVVSADPSLHNPSPMFKSVFFKDDQAEAIALNGWNAWERKSSRDPGEPQEVLVGASQPRMLDLIRFERMAKGLDQGHRQLLAEKFGKGLAEADTAPYRSERHRLVRDLGMNEAALFDLIDTTARLKMAVRGWVAEVHLEKELRTIPGVENCARINREGEPDISLKYRGKGPFLIECKNVLRQAAADGTPRLDFQKTRASKADKCSRYYRPSDFPIVAACLHSITEKWEFCYAPTSMLPPHSECKGRIKSALRVDDRWRSDVRTVLDIVAGAA